MPEFSGVINSYTELLDAVCDTLLRPDLSNEAARWIQQTELELLRDCDIRPGDQKMSGTIAASANTLELPRGTIEIRSIQVTDAGSRLHTLSVASPDRVISARDGDASGIPTLYFRQGSTIEFGPAVNDSASIPYEMIYYGLPTPLSEQNPSNMVLELGSDALMYGALVHGARRINDPERLANYEAAFVPAKRSLKNTFWRSRLSGPLEQRPDFYIDDRHSE